MERNPEFKVWDPEFKYGDPESKYLPDYLTWGETLCLT
jgi:hypothetical protein